MQNSKKKTLAHFNTDTGSVDIHRFFFKKETNRKSRNSYRQPHCKAIENALYRKRRSLHEGGPV